MEDVTTPYVLTSVGRRTSIGYGIARACKYYDGKTYTDNTECLLCFTRFLGSTKEAVPALALVDVSACVVSLPSRAICPAAIVFVGTTVVVKIFAICGYLVLVFIQVDPSCITKKRVQNAKTEIIVRW